MNAADFIDRLPKAELHLHIEGTLEPEMAFALAGRNGAALPYRSVDELRRAYDFHDLQSFLDVYYAAAAALRTAEDFYELTFAYLAKVSSENVRHVEIFFDPQTHTARGVPFAAVTEGIHSALADGGENFGISFRLIPCFLRHLGEDDAFATLEEALPYKKYFTAVGLDSSELGHPPSKFTRVFARAKKAGLPAVVHAGEEGPPQYISEALDLLHARRIDHGVRCAEDNALVQRLAREQVPLTVCPLSNVALRVFARLEEHNLKQLLQRGLCVTINSDDPAYFGGYLRQNYTACEKALGLSREELAMLAKNSFRASFLGDKEKARYAGEIDRVLAAEIC